MSSAQRTQVGIVGAGPAGLLLSQLLDLAGIDNVVLERRSREHVLGRVRAGVLEQSTVEILRGAGVGARLALEGLVHGGIELVAADRRVRVDFAARGASVLVYGQTELTRDLVEARAARGGDLRFDVENVALEGVDGAQPRLAFVHEGVPQVLECDFIAGCDGFHGACRKAIPPSAMRTHERIYPFAWLGVLADVPPLSPELVYSSHERGFALCSMRSAARSRCYVQCDRDDNPVAWSDAQFWDELAARLPHELASRVVAAPAIEKSLAALRSFVIEPLRYGRLFLAGDAAHIVPPTGAKGLNLAVQDVAALAAAFTAHYRDADDALLDGYSRTALRRIWRAERFSAWLTSVLHKFPAQSSFDRELQLAELDQLAGSAAAQAAFVESYTGVS